MREPEPPSADLEGVPDPVSELPWSADFVMQAIEILVVTLREGRILTLGPEHADSFIVGWPAGAKPEVVAASTVERLGLRPVVLHSTSWRHQGAEVVLTYLAVVDPAFDLPESWFVSAVAHAELARGDALAPPPVIGVAQVLEHALRHLTWLTKDDEVIGRTLADWRDALAGYVPEPFRALGGPPI